MRGTLRHTGRITLELMAVTAAAVALIAGGTAVAQTTFTATAYQIPTAAAQPYHVVTGADGNLWLTELEAGKIAHLNPTTGTITETALDPESYPHGITEGADGAVWFCEQRTDRIGRLGVDGQLVTELALPKGSGPAHIVQLGTTTLYFAETGTNKIGTLDIVSRQLGREYAIPTRSSGLNGITAGADGKIYAAEQGANKVARLDPKSGVITEFAVPAALHVSPGPDGNVWVTEQNASSIGVITPQGKVRSYHLASGGHPNTMMASTDGKSLWFTESPGTPRLGRITITGSISELAGLSSMREPVGITLGPDQKIWFVDRTADLAYKTTLS